MMGKETDTATPRQGGDSRVHLVMRARGWAGTARRAEKQILESGGRGVGTGKEEREEQLHWGWVGARAMGMGGHLGLSSVGRIGGTGEQSLAETNGVPSVLMAPQAASPPRRPSKNVQRMDSPLELPERTSPAGTLVLAL